MKKLFALLLSVFTLVACSTPSKTATTQQQTPTKVKVGVVGAQAQELWEFVAKKAEKENIAIEIVNFSDYVKPNTALEEGSLDMNAFQHRAYLAQWNKDHKTDIKEIGTTFMVPLYYYSNKYKSLKDLPNKAKVLIPSEVAIQGRALIALQTEGLIKLKNGGSTRSNVADIVENPRELEIIEAESAQAPRLLADVDAASINGSMAKDAGLDVNAFIFSDGNHLDTIPNDRYNIIAVKGKDVDNAVYKKIVALFQQDDTAKKMNDIAPGMFIPVWKK